MNTINKIIVVTSVKMAWIFIFMIIVFALLSWSFHSEANSMLGIFIVSVAITFLVLAYMYKIPDEIYKQIFNIDDQKYRCEEDPFYDVRSQAIWLSLFVGVMTFFTLSTLSVNHLCTKEKEIYINGTKVERFTWVNPFEKNNISFTAPNNTTAKNE